MNGTQTSSLAKAYGRLAKVPYANAMVHDIMSGQLARVRSDVSKGRVTASHVAEVRDVLRKLDLIPTYLRTPADNLVRELETTATRDTLKWFLAHHRISSLRGTSDTLDERFLAIDALIK